MRVEQWAKKLCMSETNPIWKKNRNLYAIKLLDNVLNQILEKPYLLVPPETSLPLLSKSDLMSKISSKYKEWE